MDEVEQVGVFCFSDLFNDELLQFVDEWHGEGSFRRTNVLKILYIVNSYTIKWYFTPVKEVMSREVCRKVKKIF